jgi:hypothetical protein
MTTFALISEGLTDQIVLTRIIELFFKETIDDDIFINPLQPLRDATDRVTAPHGGWELVLEYCEESIDLALEANDYVVVHIDTDMGDHPNYGLPLTLCGVDRLHRDLVADAKRILISKIDQTTYNTYYKRLIFAIAVHSTESWLLLCLFDVNEPKRSFERLNRILVKRNEEALTKCMARYSKLVKNIKRKSLLNLDPEEHSLGFFLKQLSELTNT